MFVELPVVFYIDFRGQFLHGYLDGVIDHFGTDICLGRDDLVLDLPLGTLQQYFALFLGIVDEGLFFCFALSDDARLKLFKFFLALIASREDFVDPDQETPRRQARRGVFD